QTHPHLFHKRPYDRPGCDSYAQYSYGFNYYGTIGTNRDEFVLVRKMDRVDWLDDEVSDTGAHA
ncbi:MAG: hypothetical protein C0470_09810, partial [Verminephrobacter sp.]|nr:hypothetical protein [Verminephrobacter sp.]